MNNIFIFHGTGGNPKENWFHWLKDELEKKGCKVFIPKFPNSDKPLLKPWLSELEKYQDKFDEHTIFVGHSLGGLFLLRVLERLDKPVKAAIIVSGSAGVKPIKFYDGDYNFSNGFEFDWKKIRSSAGQFVVYHSDNDPFISLGNGELIAKKLGAKLNFIPNAGHFNAMAGYTKFDKLFEKVMEMLS
jgi:predicted alpha/beta hydrolase family esterase